MHVLKSFILRNDGTIFVQVLIYTILLLGTAGLAVDFGRVYSVNTQMQAYADHIALAVAAELDGSADAIDRGNRVVDGFTGNTGALLRKQTAFTASGDDILVRAPVYLTDLPNDPDPDDPNYPIADVAGLTTTDGTAASHVLIQVVPNTVRYALLPFLSLMNSNVAVQAETNAVAIATLESEVCNAPPLMICNPWEINPGDPVPANGLIVGKQIRAKQQGPNSQWAPGNFGLLQLADSAGGEECSSGNPTSADKLRCVFALNEPNSACVGSRVSTRPGEAVAIHTGVNVRFDMWNPPLQNKKNNPLYKPAPNVIKGIVPDPAASCKAFVPATDTVAFPRDACFLNSPENCPNYGAIAGPGDIGTGMAAGALAGYWTTNHANSTQPALPAGTTTRYEAYLEEIALGETFLDALGDNVAGSEDGAPRCYNGSAFNTLQAKRRVLVLAVLNCKEHNVQGNTPNVPVLRHLEMFMTEPITPVGNNHQDENDSSGALWLEVIRAVTPGDDSGVLHEFPVLVR